MGTSLQDNLRLVLSRAVEEAARSAGTAGGSTSSNQSGSADGPLSGMRGVLAGAGAAALAPVAIKGVGKLAKGAAVNGLGDIASGPAKVVEKLGDGVGGAVGEKLSKKVDESGGAAGLLKDAAKSALPFGGGEQGEGGKGGAPGVGKGRRMPVQQSVDIGIPLESVYNQWTQFEEWPNFMHRVTRVTQEDDCTVSFAVKVWGRKREFTAKIDTQRPDDRIKWNTSEGMTHTGVVTFHELGPNLTRILLGFDVDPGGLLEKFARGARYIKRAARADLHRFKAYIEAQEQETGAWRGRIEDGELVEEHDPKYDKQREYLDDEQGSDRGGQRKSRGSRDGSGRSSSQRKRSSSRRQAAGSRTRGSSRASSSRGSGSTGEPSRSGSSRSSNRSGSSRSSNRSGSSSRRSSSGSRSRAAASRSNGRG